MQADPKAKRRKTSKSKKTSKAPSVSTILVLDEPEPTPEPIIEPDVDEAPKPSKSSKKKNRKKSSQSNNNTQQPQAEVYQTQSVGKMEDVLRDVLATTSVTEEHGAEWVMVSKQKQPKAKQIANQKQPIASVSNGDEVINTRELQSMHLGKYTSIVIGRGGKTIKAIQDETGATLKISQDSAICTFDGDDEQVEAAMACVQDILDREQEFEEKTQVEIIALGDKIAAVIGKRGANINKISTESQADLKVNKMDNTVTITGEAHQVEKARQLVELYMAGGPPPEVTQEVELSSERERYIILGKKGATIKAIQQESGARCTLEQDKSYVLVEGDAAQVALAVASIQRVIAENSFQAEVSTMRNIPAIIGKNGATINDIRDKSGASVNIFRDVVRIIGTRDQVERAQTMVKKILAKEMAPAWSKLSPGEVVVDCIVPRSAVGMVIGRDGMMIHEIKENTGAKIAVDSTPGSPQAITKIWGAPSSVEKAQERIAEILDRHAKQQERRKQRELQNAAQNEGEPNQEQEASKGSGENEDQDELHDETRQEDWDGGWDSSSNKASEAAPGW